MRSEGGEGQGLEQGPSRLQAVARQPVQERSAASRGQNVPDRSASPEPGSAPWALRARALSARLHPPLPRPGPSHPARTVQAQWQAWLRQLKAWGFQVAEGEGTKDLWEKLPIHLYAVLDTDTQRRQEIKKNTETQRHTQLGNSRAYRIVRKLGGTHRHAKVTPR